MYHRYSLPMRRAGSPVQLSSGPRIPKLTLAACITLAKAVATLRLRASKDPMQPTQYSTSTSGFSASVLTLIWRAQSARVSLLISQGFWFRSRLVKRGVTSDGNLLSSITRYRRISSIFCTCSIETGQIHTGAAVGAGPEGVFQDAPTHERLRDDRL